MGDHDDPAPDAPDDAPAPAHALIPEEPEPPLAHAPAHALALEEPSSPLRGGGQGEGGVGPTADIVPPPAPTPDVEPTPPPPGPSPQGGGKKRQPRIGRALLVAALALIALVLLPVLAFRVLPPPVTILMLQRMAQGQGMEKHWRPLSAMAASLPQAVIAAEDARFCEHHGFDFEAMEAAARANERAQAQSRNGGSAKVRGGSTISQQTAKNVFLWPGRDYVRKGLEAGYTVLIETLWGKRRIIEVYLNVVEWGPGLYGAEAASQRYFKKPASALSPAEAARLAAILPSPLKWRAVNPGRYVARRTRRIGANAVLVREDDLAGCIRR